MDTLKNMNQNNNSSRQKRPIVSDNFLEAFKSIGGSVARSAKKDLLKGTVQSAADQIFNRRASDIFPNMGTDQKPSLEKIINQEKEVVKGFYERTRQREKVVFSQREQEVKLQIQALREDIKKLIKATGEVAQETEKVAMEEVVSPGTYHVSFFEKIRSLLLLARKRIEESKSWLSLWKSRSKKRNYYWRQVRKSGTKFMLSQERYMSTQMG